MKIANETCVRHKGQGEGRDSAHPDIEIEAHLRGTSSEDALTAML